MRGFVIILLVTIAAVQAVYFLASHRAAFCVSLVGQMIAILWVLGVGMRKRSHVHDEQ